MMGLEIYVSISQFAFYILSMFVMIFWFVRRIICGCLDHSKFMLELSRDHDATFNAMLEYSLRKEVRKVTQKTTRKEKVEFWLQVIWPLFWRAFFTRKWARAYYCKHTKSSVQKITNKQYYKYEHWCSVEEAKKLVTEMFEPELKKVKLLKEARDIRFILRLLNIIVMKKKNTIATILVEGRRSWAVTRLESPAKFSKYEMHLAYHTLRLLDTVEGKKTKIKK